MKKRLTIIFDGIWVAYSPTTIALYDLLSEYFEVTIIAQNPRHFDNNPLPNRKVIYINELLTKNQYRLAKTLFAFRALFNKEERILKGAKPGIDASEKINFLEIYNEFNFIKNHLAKEKPDFIIAVDSKNLWFTQILGKKVEFLSLEITPQIEFFQNQCNFENINSVIIQTKERYDYLFKNAELRTFYIQNAPVFTPPQTNNHREGLIFSGTASDEYGFFICLDFLKIYPEYTLTLRGAMVAKNRVETDYADLITNKNLIVDEKYLDDSEVVNYLRQFKIGFCFYNFKIKQLNTFHFRHVPSGKMFKYFAAGVPVIGVDIPGLKPIKDFEAGILIKDLEPENIKKAIDTIESNYDYYSQNCLKAAEHYSFDKMAKPFVDYLLEKV
jgi:glycosyltransferase involved in cell wall biosynthesis